jgi:hypothetical protein
MADYLIGTTDEATDAELDDLYALASASDGSPVLLPMAPVLARAVNDAMDAMPSTDPTNQINSAIDALRTELLAQIPLTTGLANGDYILRKGTSGIQWVTATTGGGSAPAAPTISAVETNDVVTAAEASDGVTISGTAAASATVAVSWGTVNKSTTASGGGAWTVTYAAGEVPSPGSTTVAATASNSNGPSPTTTRAVTVEGATLLMTANGFASTTIIQPASTVTGNYDQYLRGGDFNTRIWSQSSIYSWYVLGIIGNGNPESTTNYVANTFKTVMGRDGTNSRALSLAIKKDAPQTGVEQIRMTEYQTAGVAGTVTGTHTRVEPVFYQRMWVKFDVNTLARAVRIGSSNFYQILWEAKAEPDFRFRIQLEYSGTKLIWQSQTDILTNANAIHEGYNTTTDVVLSAHTASTGWHKIEVYMNRPLGIFRTAVDGTNIINLSGASLMGTSGNILNFPMFMQVYSTNPMAGLAANNDGPIEMLVEDFELYNLPPADAWT